MNRLLIMPIILTLLSPAWATDWMEEGRDWVNRTRLRLRSNYDFGAMDSLRMMDEEEREQREQEQALQAELEASQFDDYCRQGADAFFQGDFGGAISAWDNAMKYGSDLNLDFGYAEANFLQAMEVTDPARTQYLNVALIYYDRLLSSEAGDPGFLAARARVHAALGNAAAARADLDYNPGQYAASPSFWLTRADAYRLLGDNANEAFCRNYAQKCGTSVNPSPGTEYPITPEPEPTTPAAPPSDEQLGWRALESGEFAAAADDFRRSLAAGTASALGDAWIGAGKAYSKLGQFARADTCYAEHAHQPVPTGESETAWRRRAENARKVCDYDYAISCYRQALVLNPQNKDNWYDMHFLFSWIGQTDSSDYYQARYEPMQAEFLKRDSTEKRQKIENEPRRAARVEPESGRMPFLGKNGQGFDEYLWLKDSSVMIRIPAGTFRMGDASRSESPVHEVTLSEYFIDKCEITNQQYRKFCDAAGHKYPDDPQYPHMPDYFRNYPECPVVKVSWGDAVAYAAWAGKLLPTEAQWEKAARGTDARDFPWGNAGPGFGQLGNFLDQSYRRAKPGVSEGVPGYDDGCGFTAPVGSFPDGASFYGCLDMAGNVAEFCSDWYDEDYYHVGKHNDPEGPLSGSLRVERGGSYDHSPEYLSCHRRDQVGVRWGVVDVGFRCVRW